MAFPCKGTGWHKVVGNIKKLDPSDVDDAAQIKLGYKYRAPCVRCGISIVAKDKKEYKE